MPDRTRDKKTMEFYDKKYGRGEFYWTKEPSATCFKMLQIAPPVHPMRLLDIGCGEGRNAVFFARNGYAVDAMDISENGVQKTLELARQAGARLNAFQADVNEYRLEQEYDILFSTAVFQCIPPGARDELFSHYKEKTNPDGIHAFTVFVRKPFIPSAPDGDPNSSPWKSGELFSYYHDWKIEWCTEEIFDCMSSGVPHQHAVNRLIAKKESS